MPTESVIPGAIKSGKHCGKRRNCTFCAISSFVTMFSKSCLVQRRQKASIWGKGLINRINISLLTIVGVVLTCISRSCTKWQLFIIFWMKEEHNCISLNTSSGENVLKTLNHSLNHLIVLANILQKYFTNTTIKFITFIPIIWIIKTNVEYN